MSLVRYYLFHSFVNQIRKLLHSWFVIFVLVCALLGGLAGFGAGALVSHQEEQALQEQSTESEEDLEAEAEQGRSEAMEVIGKFVKDYLGELPKKDTAPLIAAVAILAMLLFFASRADTAGGKIFLPADVNLLFTSPMRAQSVLIFRLIMGLGGILFFVVYFFFVTSVDGTLFSAKKMLMVVTILLTIATSLVLQSMLYVYGSVHRSFHKRMTYGVIAFLALLLAGFALFMRTTGVGTDRLVGLHRFLNAPGTNLIPIWGWLKAIVYYANVEAYGKSVLFIALSVAGLAGMVWVLYRQKADFFEDAMHQSEKKAAKLEKYANSRNAFTSAANERTEKQEKKIRKAKRDRDLKGFGASVFYFSAMKKRADEAPLPPVTRTMLVYLAAAFLGSIAGRYFMNSNGLLPALIVLGVMVFYRSLGNPLAQDLQMSYYTMIPENAWKKFFFSCMGGTVGSMIDLLPACVLLVIRYRTQWLQILMGFALLISLDLYATITSAFIDAVIPKSVDRMPRQIFQVMFLYFGLIPDAVILIVSSILDHTKWMLLICLAVNLVLAGIFFLITPMILEPTGSAAPKPSMETFALRGGSLKKASAVFSGTGAAIFVMLVLTVVLQLGIGYLAERFFPQVLEVEWMSWILSFAPQYLIGMPIGIWLLRRVGKEEKGTKQSARLGIPDFLSAFSICVFMMVIGAIVGQIFTLALNRLLATNDTVAAQEMALGGALGWKILIMVILAPVFEELIFRKSIIDNVKVYGETTAIFVSAAMFGLFHGNFTQMFYAFGIGLVFGTIYARTGRLRYSVALHMIINFCGAVLVPWLTADLIRDPMHATESATRSFIIYMVIYLALAVIGFVLFALKVSTMNFKAQPLQLPYRKSFKTAWVNPGMGLFLLGCIALVVYSLVR